jgi:hypothetical protein
MFFNMFSSMLEFGKALAADNPEPMRDVIAPQRADELSLDNGNYLVGTHQTFHSPRPIHNRLQTPLSKLPCPRRCRKIDSNPTPECTTPPGHHD